MKIWRGEKVFDCVVIKIKTPEGNAILIINELDGCARELNLMIGKAGSGIRAWSFAIGKALTLAMKHGASIEDIIGELSNIHSDRAAYSGGSLIKSGVDGLVKGLMKYQSDKFIHQTTHLSDMPSFGGM